MGYPGWSGLFVAVVRNSMIPMAQLIHLCVKRNTVTLNHRLFICYQNSSVWIAMFLFDKNHVSETVISLHKTQTQNLQVQ